MVSLHDLQDVRDGQLDADGVDNPLVIVPSGIT